MRIRHTIELRPSTRPVTPRRIAAAQRALQRERDRMPLLAPQIASEQETAEQRIVRIDAEHVRHQESQRLLAAQHWRWGRQQLMQLREETRRDILAAWNASTIPPTAAYFADFIRTQLKRRGIPLHCDA